MNDWNLHQLRTLPDGRTEVIYSLGPADRVTVVLARTDNLPLAIQRAGDQLQHTEGR